jgi:hypothetical protein
MNIIEATAKIKALLEREEQEKSTRQLYVRSFYSETKELLFMDVVDDTTSTINAEWYNEKVTTEIVEGDDWTVINYLKTNVGTLNLPKHTFSLYRPLAA